MPSQKHIFLILQGNVWQRAVVQLGLGFQFYPCTILTPHIHSHPYQGSYMMRILIGHSQAHLATHQTILIQSVSGPITWCLAPSPCLAVWQPLLRTPPWLVTCTHRTTVQPPASLAKQVFTERRQRKCTLGNYLGLSEAAVVFHKDSTRWDATKSQLGAIILLATAVSAGRECELT